MDELNSFSYAYHYRNLDSTESYAHRAYGIAADYSAGKAEALNNMAFVRIVRMDYGRAKELLDEVGRMTDNQIELLVADVLQMRLCQRMSANKEFYDYRERARGRLRRINEERNSLPERVRGRLIYAETEFAIVNSAYYYYVGLEQRSVEALSAIATDGEIKKDTAQYLNYLYNVGSGGIITDGTPAEICQKEFEHLMRCFILARRHGYPFFEGNSLEALTEHIMLPEQRDRLLADNPPSFKYINPDGISDDELAISLAKNALQLFLDYGDVYQIAAAYRTLASCFMAVEDYASALLALESALSNEKIAQAPDLVASIREQLSVAYSAIDDKPSSDYNRNIYLDLQEQTRQDRYLEARADMFDKASSQLNVMIMAVIAAIILLVFMLWLFYYLNRKNRKGHSLDELLSPLRAWRETYGKRSAELLDRIDEINEAYALSVAHIHEGERRNLENRAKVSLVNSVTPLIDRMMNELRLLETRCESAEVRSARYVYISELADKINEYNDVLTHWIQLRQGQIDLHIESFPLQPLFDIVAKSKTGFLMSGVELRVRDTGAVVKADRVLTLFMINTLADNARKFTPRGGTVTVSAEQSSEYVEIAVEDTGCGMSDDERARIFDHKIYNGHGFGLMNCRGIIDKYRKLSRIFDVCQLSADSVKGQGSRFFFRLPRGAARLLLLLFALIPVSVVSGQTALSNLSLAKMFADSAYFSNIDGTYEQTLHYADSCRKYLNRHYLAGHPGGRLLMEREGDASSTPAEIRWFRDSIPTNYNIIIDIRNESAVAALALHRWQLYNYNNKVYTQLFKEMSADNTLAGYCRMMEQSQTNKTIAVILLLLVLIVIPPAYYLLYYRHRLYYRFCVDRIGAINAILLSDMPPSEKLREIEPLAHGRYPDQLRSVVDSIVQALRDADTSLRKQLVDIEMAEDECRRAEYEYNNLYVRNSVLDNCLSTLKHETMYYPSRIRRLADGTDANLHAMSELAAYYRDIYSILSQQAMRQVDRLRLHIEAVPAGEFASAGDTGRAVACDRDMMKYLFAILRKQSGRKTLDVAVRVKDDRYLVFTVSMPDLHLTDGQAAVLFTPSVGNIPYLLCRQIVRDLSEATNRRGCGISAEVSDGATVIKITLPIYEHRS